MARSEQYEELTSVLRRVLSPFEVRFFSNSARLSTVLGLVEKWASSNSRVIDLASGPFVLDFALENRGYKNIIAVDRNPGLKEVYQELRDKNILKHTLFYEADIAQYTISKRHSADLVILNDALFYRTYSLQEVVPKVSQSLSDGGIFIFDIWSLEFYQRFRLLYELVFPRYKAFRRYMTNQVVAILRQGGFEVKEAIPYFSRVPGRRFFEKLVWYVFHLSNTTYFVTRKAV